MNEAKNLANIAVYGLANSLFATAFGRRADPTETKVSFST